MNKEFTPYKEALELKELGFNEPCFTWYWDDIHVIDDMRLYNSFGYGNHNKNPNLISAPTFSQAFRWFRKKYGLSGWVNESFVGSSRQGVISVKSEIGLKYCPTTTKFFDTYEEAELACLKKLIEIVENGK
jgi:hypothetical protein